MTQDIYRLKGKLHICQSLHDQKFTGWLELYCAMLVNREAHKERDHFLQPPPTFQNYTSSSEMQNVCVFIYRYTHTLNSRGSFLTSVTLPALQGGMWAPDQALPLLPAQRAQLCKQRGRNCPVPAPGERAWTRKDGLKDCSTDSQPHTDPLGLQGSTSCPFGMYSPRQGTEQGTSALQWQLQHL